VLVILYLAFWIFIGNYVLLNLFLAVLLDSFNGDNTIIDDSEFDNLVLSPQVIENFKKITDDEQQIDRFANNEELLNELTQDMQRQNLGFIYFENVDCEHSLYIFSKQNIIRRW
jgi:hypothetical protein